MPKPTAQQIGRLAQIISELASDAREFGYEFSTSNEEDARGEAAVQALVDEATKILEQFKESD